MSTGIGMKCVDGIVVGCDTGSVVHLGCEMTRLDQGKYFKITDNIQLVGSGGRTDVLCLVDEIIEHLPEHNEMMSLKEFRYVLEDSALVLHSRYNLQQSPPIRDSNEPRFEGDSLVCFRNVDGDIGLFLVLLNGNVEIITHWHPLGSLAPVGEHLLQQLYIPTIDVQTGLRIAYYVLGEIIRMDPWSAGKIEIGYLTPNEPYVDLLEQQMQELHDVVQEKRDILHNQVYMKLFDDDFDLPKGPIKKR